MKTNLFISAVAMYIAVYFAWQTPRAATPAGSVIVLGMAVFFLIAALVFLTKWEREFLHKGRVPKSIRFTRDRWPEQDGVYAVEYLKGEKATASTAITYFTEGQFLNMKTYQIVGWAGPYSSPDEILKDTNPLY